MLCVYCRKILCANPVNADDWTMDYIPYTRTGDWFNLTFTIDPNKPLPTNPNFRIVQLSGDQR